jgi:hypothetical protein
LLQIVLFLPNNVTPNNLFYKSTKYVSQLSCSSPALSLQTRSSPNTPNLSPNCPTLPQQSHCKQSLLQIYQICLRIALVFPNNVTLNNVFYKYTKSCSKSSCSSPTMSLQTIYSTNLPNMSPTRPALPQQCQSRQSLL